jgi:hypothetical protein
MFGLKPQRKRPEKKLGEEGSGCDELLVPMRLRVH